MDHGSATRKRRRLSLSATGLGRVSRLLGSRFNTRSLDFILGPFGIPNAACTVEPGPVVKHSLCTPGIFGIGDLFGPSLVAPLLLCRIQFLWLVEIHFRWIRFSTGGDSRKPTIRHGFDGSKM